MEALAGQVSCRAPDALPRSEKLLHRRRCLSILRIVDTARHSWRPLPRPGWSLAPKWYWVDFLHNSLSICKHHQLHTSQAFSCVDMRRLTQSEMAAACGTYEIGRAHV